MKKLSIFQHSGPLEYVEGDFPLDQINSKDFYQEESPQLPVDKLKFLNKEESPQLPINKLEFLKRKRMKSCDQKNMNNILNPKKMEINIGKESPTGFFLHEENANVGDNIEIFKELLEFQESFELSSTPSINKVAVLKQNTKLIEHNNQSKISICDGLEDEFKSSEEQFFPKFDVNSFFKDHSSKENSRQVNKSITELDQSLYQDALRRIEKEKTRKFTKNLSLDLKENRSQTLKNRSQENSQNKIFQKLNRELLKTCELLKIQPEKLSYLQCLEIMNELGFIKYHNLKSNFKTSQYFLEERALLAKMWDLLHNFQRKNQEEIDLQVFLRFLAGIIGISPSLKSPDESDLNLTNADHSGCMTFNRGGGDEIQNKNDLLLDFKKIHRDFDSFYRNRLGFLKNDKENQLKPELKPIKLSKKSETLATKHYQKIMEDSFEKTAFHDRMARTQAMTQAKIIRKSVENTQKLLEHCSFKPSVQTRCCSQPKPSKTNQSEALKLKTTKTTEEVEFEKQKAECTFKPNLTKKLTKIENTDEKLKFQQNKSIERVEKARIERSLAKSFKERGMPFKNEVLNEIGNLSVSQINPELLKKYFGLNDKNERNERKNTNNSTISSLNKTILNTQQPKYSPLKQRMKTEEGFYTRMIHKEFDTLKEKFHSLVSADSDTNPGFSLKPILYLEINLGEGKFEKISVYEHTNPQLLAEEFAKKHDFGPNILEKLKKRFAFEIEKKKRQFN